MRILILRCILINLLYLNFIYSYIYEKYLENDDLPIQPASGICISVVWDNINNVKFLQKKKVMFLTKQLLKVLQFLQKKKVMLTKQLLMVLQFLQKMKVMLTKQFLIVLQIGSKCSSMIPKRENSLQTEKMH